MNEKVKKILKACANITIGVLAGITILAIVVGFLDKKEVKKPYDIVHPIVGNHAIIQIKSTKGGFCSAFVVSDTAAFTAGHCIDIAENQQVYIKKDIKKIEDALNKLAIIMFMASQQCPQEDPRCIAMINKIGDNANVLNQKLIYLKSLKNSEFDVINSEGKETKVKATAEYKELDRRDFGIIKGDFRNFNKLPLSKGFDVKVGDKLRMCGFPGGTIPAVCIDFKAEGPYTVAEKNYVNFYYRTTGMLVPGSSGSPVIDENGIAIGIASSADEEYSYVTPLVGLFNSK